MDKGFVNVIVLGISFFFIFTAFQTGGMIQKVVVDSINDEFSYKWGGKSWDGYVSLCIIYAVFSISNWIAPSTVALIGPKYSMVIGAVTYVIFVANFLYPMYFGLTLVSIIIGFGAAIIWTGQGNYLTLNSNPETIARNSGVFWALLQCSLLFGNLFVYFQFRGQEKISNSTRLITYAVLTGVGILGTCLMVLLPKAVSTEETDGDQPRDGILTAFVKSVKLIKTSKMILLCVTFFYTGIELSFFSGVYGTAVGSTKTLGQDSARYIGISGMLIGAGEIVGGALFGLLGKRTTKRGRDPIVLLGYLVHMVSFFIIFINLPAESSYVESSASGYIESRLSLALLCSFLLGFGDACYNTQVYSILGSIYADQSAPAFAIFKFMQSIAASIAFLYSTKVGLNIHIYILAITATFATVAFCVVEWLVKYETEARSEPKENNTEVPSPERAIN